MDRARRSKFKHKVKSKKYSWMTLPDLGNGHHETVLTVPKKNGDGYLIVVPVEKFFPTLDSLHESTGHARTFTMWNKVVSTYAGLPRSAVKKFLEGCLSCQCRASQTNEAEPRPIVADEVFSRVQVDLIDMISRPSGDYKYILHVMDHFSKFHLLHALERKTAEEVNNALTRMFGTIGLPTILQTDNGSEFSQLAKIFENWPGAGKVKIIHGRPAHPQSQGLVERGHRLVQDRLAIYESEWRKESTDKPFLWHLRLPVIQYQINTAHTSTTKQMPYKIVFGREPKSLPLFGQEVSVTEERDSGDSFSTAYDDCSDNETETSRALCREENDTDPENNAEQHTNKTDHQKIRQSALEQLKKLRQKKTTKKPRKVHQPIKVGSFVTLAVPAEYRHKCDLRRLPGIVVNMRGQQQPSYMIRTEYCLVDGWYRPDSVQMFDGNLPLVVEGWEHLQALPLRMAAAMHRQQDKPTTRCGCKKGCQKNSCRCHKHGNVCTSSCHAGRPCTNRATDLKEQDRCDQPVEAAREYTQPIIKSLQQTGFSECACETALSMLSGIATFKMLEYVAHQVTGHPDSLSQSIPENHISTNLLCYGSGYINYIPDVMRTSYKVLSASGAENMCLYNSVSLVLYGNENQSYTLKLKSLLHGAVNLNSMVAEVTQKVATTDEVIGWASGFLDEGFIQFLDVEDMITEVMKKELTTGLVGNDSGPVQIMALAHMLQKSVKIHCVQEHAEPVVVYGNGQHIIDLIRVPFNLHPADNHLRFNHFVPAIPRKAEDQEQFLNSCGAADLGFCCIKVESPDLEWVACDDCHRWYHSACLTHRVRGHTMKRQSSMKCGCARIGPFRPKSSSLLTDTREIGKFLEEHRPFLKGFLLDIAGKKIASWRENMYQPTKSTLSKLIVMSGLTVPVDDVAIKIRLFIDQEVPGIASNKYKDCVLFPEILIRLLSLKWGVNKIEAENFVKQRHYYKH